MTRPPPTRSQVIATMGGLVVSLLLAALDQTVVGPALPKVVASLGGFERYAWVVAAYLLASTVAVPIVGKMADLHGRKPLLLGGVALFVGSSALCGLAGRLPLPLDGMDQLIAFRALQGLGGGLIVTMAFTVVGDLFEPAQRARYQGFFAGAWGLASLVGPPLGGWLTDQWSWRWVFLVNVPVGALALAVLTLYFRDLHPPQRQARLDLLGVGLMVLTVVPALLAISFGPASPGLFAGGLAVAAVSLAFLLAWQRRAPAPLMPPALFRVPDFTIAVASVVTLGTVGFGAILYIPLFVQAVMGRSATESGLVLTPMSLGWVTASILGGQLLSRTGNYRAMALSGLVVVGVGELLLAGMDGRTTLGAVTANAVVLGVGMGMSMPLYPALVQGAVPRGQLATATGLVTFFRSIGATVGATVWGAVLSARMGGVDVQALAETGARARVAAPDAAGAFSLVYLLCALLLLPALVLNLRLPRRFPTRGEVA